jgi:hypothetical protein
MEESRSGESGEDVDGPHRDGWIGGTVDAVASSRGRGAKVL